MRKPLPRAALLGALFSTCLFLLAPEAGAQELSLAADGAVLSRGTVHLTATVDGLADGETLPARLTADGRPLAEVMLTAGVQQLTAPGAHLGGGRHLLALEAAGARAELEVATLPGWLSVVPPLFAITVALIFKDVLIALFSGVFLGALMLYGWNPVTAFVRAGDAFIVPALADADHATILIFSTLLGGMVGVVSKSGGTQGIVERLAPYATSSRRGQLATWAMGVLVFFDDYANSLIVGSTMRPITDRLKISREKLAYIVDSTAAPIASVIPISTWVGFEIGLIKGAFDELGLTFNAYSVFVESILYRFYPLFALVLGFAIAFSGRDFGPMLKAERRARKTGAVLGEGHTPLADYTQSGLMPRDEIPKRAINALLPIVTVITVTVAGLWISGASAVRRADFPGAFAYAREVFSEADPYNTLLWASMAGLVVAIALPLAQRLMKLREAMEGMLEGFKAMLLALVVLLLAWSIGAVCGQLHTADYVVGLTQGALAPQLLPVLVFAVSAAVAFATGTSWGVMGILMPLVIPIAHGLSVEAGHAVDSRSYYVLMLGTISSVLAGSVWGDHCSPISDTTILSSMGSGCDHIAHVRTQLPYALAIGVVGMIVGDIPTAYGLSPWLSIALGSAVIIGGLLWLGKKSEELPETSSPQPTPTPQE